MIKNRNLKVVKILDYLIVLLVILNSGYALTNGFNSLLLYSQIFLLGLVIVVNGRYFRIPKRDLRQLAVLILFISLAAAFLINMDFSAKYTYLHSVLYIVIAYFINISYDTALIISVFKKIMLAVAVISITVSIVGFVIPFSYYSFVFTNGSGVSYYSLGVVNYIKSTFSDNPRCCGIFWEPGLYAGFLGLAALLDLKTTNDSKLIFRVIVYCLAIFFTYSTAGFFYILMILLLCIARYTDNLVGTVVFSIIGVLLVLVLLNVDYVFAWLIKVSPQVFSKFLWKNESYLTRSMSPLADLSIIIHNPLGVGYGNIQSIRVETLKSFGADISLSTSTLTYHGASCGVLFLITYNVLWIKNFILYNRNILFKILSFLLFIMILTSNPMYNIQFIWIFLFFAFPKADSANVQGS